MDRDELLSQTAFLAILLRRLRQRHTGDACEFFHRLRKTQTLYLHEKGKYIPVFTAGKAMVETFMVIDGEGRCLLVFERAQTDEPG